jgi:predicted amidohydrolase
MEHLSLDLWAANLEVPTPDLATWLARLETRLAASAAQGARMLVLPEFACAQWLSFSPPTLPATGILGWLAETGAVALPAMAELSHRHGVSLLPGTIPHPAGDRSGIPAFTNRAWLLTPEGARHHQDKLSLTPMEAQGASGVTLAGTEVAVIPWNGLRVVIAICLDVEFTALWSRLGELDLDLVLVPAKTDMITGYARVFACARARAIELQTAICVVGAVGVPLGQPLTDTGVGGAAAYLPCDISLHADGIFADLAAHPASALTDPLLPIRGLPVGATRRIRNGGAEAEINPSGWRADHLAIRDPA